MAAIDALTKAVREVDIKKGTIEALLNLLKEEKENLKLLEEKKAMLKAKVAAEKKEAVAKKKESEAKKAAAAKLKKQQKNIECNPKKKCKLIKPYRKHKRNPKGLLECNICNMSFQKDSTYSMHYKNVHPPSGKEKFKCLHPDCGYESYNKSSVDNHTHPTCPFCNKNLKTISGLYSHISKVCHKNQKGADESHYEFGKRIYNDFNKNLNLSVKREATALVKPKVQRIELIDSDSVCVW